MKSKFCKTWNSSKQPRKQVKFRANAPAHIKRTFMGSLLDKSLREKYGRRTIEVKKGDEVKIMRGKFKGKQGKVGQVDIKNTRLQVEGVQRSKRGGEKLITWFHPSKVKIIVLDDKDSRRLNKSAKAEKKVAPSGVPSEKGKVKPEKKAASKKAETAKKEIKETKEKK
jgi:large subunit ribosomal protein L24